MLIYLSILPDDNDDIFAASLLTLICLGWRVGVRGIKLTPPPVVFQKMYLISKWLNHGFLWLLIFSQNTSFLKISLNLLKSFKRYEEILCQYWLLSALLGLISYFNFSCLILLSGDMIVFYICLGHYVLVLNIKMIIIQQKSTLRNMHYT